MRVDRVWARTDRAGRAVRFGLLTALVTGVGHVLAGGLPTPTVLIVAAGFAAWHRLSLGGRRLTWPRLIAVAAAAQSSAHVVLWLGGHEHSGAGSASSGVPGGAMLLIHAALAVAMAVALRTSEARLLARLWFELLVRMLLRVLQPYRLQRRACAPFPAKAGAVRLPALTHSIRRRGPPPALRLPYFLVPALH